MEDLIGHDKLAAKPTSKPKRIDAQYVSHEIQHLFHLEKGFLFTVKELLLRPGKAIREFLLEDRNKLVKPVVFLIFTCVIFTLIAHYSGIKFTLFGISGNPLLKGNDWAKKISDWQNGHFGYTNLFIITFVGLWIRLFFRKQPYNLFETVVLLCYAFGQSILLLIPFIPLTKVTDSPIPFLVGMAIYFLYLVWAIGQFFGEKKPGNYIYALVSLLFGIFTYMNLLVVLAYLLKRVTH